MPPSGKDAEETEKAAADAQVAPSTEAAITAQKAQFFPLLIVWNPSQFEAATLASGRLLGNRRYAPSRPHRNVCYLPRRICVGSPASASRHVTLKERRRCV